MRILVCGGRDYQDSHKLYKTLDHYLKECDLIIHGGAEGADTLAGDWAHMNYIACLEIPANWPKYKKSAGPIRNREMLRRSKPDLVIAFPTTKSIGTYDMITISELAGVKTLIIKES